MGFERLAAFVDDHDVKMLVSKLEASCSVQSRQDDFAALDKCRNALLFSISVFFPQFFYVAVNGSPLSTVACLFDADLFVIHLLTDIFDDGGSFRGLCEHIKRVI